MDVTIDGERNFRFEGEPPDMMSALVAINDFLRKNRRGMLAVRMDGANLMPDELVEAMADKPVSGVNTLEIDSEDLQMLVDSCLSEMEENLPDLPRVCHEMAEVFHGEEPTQGFEPFEQLAAIWRNIKSREMQVATALNIPLADLELEGQAVREMHEELNRFLKEAVEALKVQDCVVLGDLLEYELAPRAEAEARIVALLREKMEEQSG